MTGVQTSNPPPEPWQPTEAAQPPLLVVEHLRKYYRELPAVQGVTFRVAAGELVGLVGPNGAGKTTVLRCITGILRATAGTVLCGGFDAVQQSAEAKRMVSFVPETPNLYELLTVIEHLRFIHMAYGETTEFEPLAAALLGHLELEEKRHALVATLSKGMKQKLAVACAFIHSSCILLFDEPFIGIDPAGQRAVRALMNEAAARGAAVLVSSHILETVEQLCDRVLILHRGSLIADGSLGELRARAQVGGDVSLEDVFLTLTAEAEEAR